jgi:hypothetical protein
MAKKKAAEGVNKAQAIRDYFAAHPEAKGVDVVTALAAKGIKVAPAQVSNVKTAASKKQTKASGAGNGKKPGRKAKASGTEVGNGIAASVRAALALLKATGSASEAKALIDVLAASSVPF